MTKEYEPTPGTKGKTPVTMTKDDRNAFFDLQLQQAASSAEKASHATGTALLASSKIAVTLAKAALASPNPSASSGGLKATLDGVYAKFFDLLDAVDKDGAAKAYAPEIRAVMTTFTTRFQELGWKPSKTAADIHAREKVADAAGATTLSTTETRSLGVLHLRDAREVLVKAYDRVQEAGDLGLVPAAAAAIARAQGLLAHPSLVGELGPIADDVAATEQVFARLASLVHDPKKQSALHSLASYLDSISVLVDRPAISGPRVGIAPKGKDDAKDKDKPANEVDPGAPRAEPPMHRPKDPPRTYTRYVFLRDYNYEDEDLGYVELRIDAVSTPSGQVYCPIVKAIDHINNRLSMGADVTSHSYRTADGRHFCDVEFLVHIGGPNVTDTTEMGLEGKIGVEGAEISGSIKHSRSTTRANTEPFLRRFRIFSGAKHQELEVRSEKDMTVIDTNLFFTELERQDIDKLVIDSADNDNTNMIQTDWHIESY